MPPVGAAGVWWVDLGINAQSPQGAGWPATESSGPRVGRRRLRTCCREACFHSVQESGQTCVRGRGRNGAWGDGDPILLGADPSRAAGSGAPRLQRDKRHPHPRPRSGFLLSLVPVRLPWAGPRARPWGAGLKKKTGLCFRFTWMQLEDSSPSAGGRCDPSRVTAHGHHHFLCRPALKALMPTHRPDGLVHASFSGAFCAPGLASIRRGLSSWARVFPTTAPHIPAPLPFPPPSFPALPLPSFPSFALPPSSPP